MADPIISAAVEEAFVPLLIHNNQAGKDVEVLERFKEPAWNYQVIRFLDAEGKDIIPRKDKVWSKAALVPRMVSALEKSKSSVPEYLALTALELDTKAHHKVALSMFCFWTGEVKLGQIQGVVNTEAGWLDGREVTLVTYHSEKITLADLIEKAAKVKCASQVYLAVEADRIAVAKLTTLKVGVLDETYKQAKAGDQKKQVNTLKLPKGLTPAQLTKLNSWYRVDKKKALRFLTPGQGKSL